jgi:hypothetical protein
MFNRLSAQLLAISVVVIGVVIFSIPNLSYGFDFEPRSVTLSTGTPSAVATHSFILAPPTTNNIGSLVFEYCANTPVVYASCTPPVGIDASSTSLVSQTGNVGFSIDTADSTNSKIVLSRPSAPGIITPSTYIFDNITNPSTPGETVYVRLTSYASNDGSGPFIDKGAVAFAVQTNFTVSTFVPPFLKFCVGITVAPDCSSMTGDSIDLGTLLPSRASAGQSQFATGTNDPTGYIVYALGNTMTSGNNTIQSLASPSPSFPGTAQFGINLRGNLIPAVGQDPVGLGSASPTANYNIPNRYTFNSGDSIAASILGSDYNRMTVSYMVNVPANQLPGVYATTFTYLATVQF